MPKSVYMAVLRRAAEILGGKGKLRAYLRVSVYELDAWMEGKEPPPRFIFLHAVDVVSAQLSGPSPDVIARAQELRSTVRRVLSEARDTRDRSDETIARASATVERSRAVLADLLRGGKPSAAAPCNVSVQEFVAAKFTRSRTGLMLEAALNAAVNSTSANRANIQLVSPSGLRIVAQLGFEQPFLEFFEIVRHDTPSTCGHAQKQGQRVVVPQVSIDPIFAGTPAAKVMDEAGARACQSTPLVTTAGRVIGMLSTHYETPHEPTADELHAIDRVAQRASFWLEGAYG